MTYGNISQLANAIATTAYFDCGIGSEQQAPISAVSTLDQLFQACYDAIPSLSSDINAQAAVAKQFNVSLIAYEGFLTLLLFVLGGILILFLSIQNNDSGPAIVEYNAMMTGIATPGLTDKFIAMNRDSRMQDLYIAYLNGTTLTGVPLTSCLLSCIPVIV